MTIAYPDVSNYEGNMPLEAATVAVCAKASEGTTYADPFFAHFKAEANRVGAILFAYHFLHAGNGAAQARHCFSVTGPGVNTMIDHEPTAGSNPSLQDAVDFATEYRALGGLCSLDYLPHWYWVQLGSPSLAPLASAGLSLVSSDYTGYSDTGPGWASYGGVDPVIWQWTDALAYSGQTVDFNAYRGTLDQLRALLGYTAPDPAPQPQEREMARLLSVQADPANPTVNQGIWFQDGLLLTHVLDVPDGEAFLGEGLKEDNITFAQFQQIRADIAATMALGAGTLSLDAASAAALGQALAANLKLPSTFTLGGSETVTVTGTGKLS